jgi:hypothetical protein
MSNTYVSKFDVFVIVCDVYVFMFDASMLVSLLESLLDVHFMYTFVSWYFNVSVRCLFNICVYV